MPTFMEGKDPVGRAQKSSTNAGPAGGGSGGGPWTRSAEGSALRELEPLPGARLAGLLAFLLARVASDVAGLLERRPELGLHLLQGARDAVRDRAGLARDPAAGDVRG